MKTTGERIRYYRQALGLSLQEVASTTEVSRYSIFRYEDGSISNIPQENLEAIARTLHVKPCTLCGWDQHLSECNSKAIYDLNDLYEALAERIPLSVDEIKSTLAFAIAMKG